jgi:adenine C2-methylase RlmN of 23S rRNA A2503 and tRNA A37
MSNNKDFDKMSDQLKELGKTLKAELDQTRTTIQQSEIDDAGKEFLHKELKNIEDAIADPEKGLSLIMSSINSLNNSIKTNGN